MLDLFLIDEYKIATNTSAGMDQCSFNLDDQSSLLKKI